MKKRLYLPNMLPPLKTVAKGYEYYSTASSYGMIYLRKKLGEGRDAPEVFRWFRWKGRID
jgi:oligopeptidase B